jgi:hypothetical protein
MALYTAEIGGQKFEKRSDARKYSHLVAAREVAPPGQPPRPWQAYSWATREDLTRRKVQDAGRKGLETRVLPTTRSKIDPAPRIPVPPEAATRNPSETCRRCGQELESEEAKARGYGDKCWRKVRKTAAEEARLQALSTATITDREAADAARIAIKFLIGAKPCPCRFCGIDLGLGSLGNYDHDEGMLVPGYGPRQWFYVVCPGCKHEWNLEKIGITEDAVTGRTIDILVVQAAAKDEAQAEDAEDQAEATDPIKCKACGADEDQQRFSVGSFKETEDGFFIDRDDREGLLWVIQRCDICGEEEHWPATDEAAEAAAEAHRRWVLRSGGPDQEAPEEAPEYQEEAWEDQAEDKEEDK